MSGSGKKLQQLVEDLYRNAVLVRAVDGQRGRPDRGDPSLDLPLFSTHASVLMITTFMQFVRGSQHLCGSARGPACGEKQRQHLMDRGFRNWKSFAVVLKDGRKLYARRFNTDANGRQRGNQYGRCGRQQRAHRRHGRTFKGGGFNINGFLSYGGFGESKQKLHMFGDDTGGKGRQDCVKQTPPVIETKKWICVEMKVDENDIITYGVQLDGKPVQALSFIWDDAAANCVPAWNTHRGQVVRARSQCNPARFQSRSRTIEARHSLD